MKRKKYIFFLGGHDAEMIAIRELLIAHKISIVDKNLGWGAKLSAYENELAELSDEFTPVLVELRLDLDYPDNSIVIDHHNDLAGADQKTSLEQTAELLGITLDRRYQLISANDRGFIPAMKEIGASDSEIREIRAFDRKCQGVTDDDEEKAEMSIHHHSKEINDNCIVIYSLTEKTSPITDRLYGRYTHLFIITPSKEFNYFGTGSIVGKLDAIYKKRKINNPDIDCWKGGDLPHHGFFGANQTLDDSEIERLVFT